MRFSFRDTLTFTLTLSRFLEQERRSAIATGETAKGSDVAPSWAKSIKIEI